MSLDVLVIDDELDIRETISDILKDEGFIPRTAANSTQALKVISDKVPSVIILDIWLQGSDLDGLGILEIVKKKYPLMPIIVISGHGTIETAVSAIKMGAYDYIEKPFVQDKLIILIKRAYEAAKLKRENIDLRSKVIDRTELIGTSSTIIKLKNDIEKAAPTAGRVMIHGGPGSGKELTARLIHKKSKKANGPFVIFNPTCMTSEKIQQELFGEPIKQAVKGVFIKRHSILETANNGTLYIDEVADLPMSSQIKLLKFLQDQTIDRPGLEKTIKLDVRIITATAKNLQNEVQLNKFREDLYYRLNVVPIKTPSLSERKDDIPLLVKYFIKQISKLSGLKERDFSEEAIAALQSYEWPGNIRQLRNIIEWTLIMNPMRTTEEDIIRSDMLPPEVLNSTVVITKPDTNVDMLSMPLREAREVFERQYLSAQMNRFNNNISKTSAFVGMERSALHRKLKLLSIYGSNNKLNEEEEYNEEA